jgi:hypothetical protein
MLRDGLREGAMGSGVDGVVDGHGARCARVHERLRRIARMRGALDAQEAEALREAQVLMLWRAHGYASLVQYMELELGYSPRAAMERLRVANIIVDLPAIASALDQGELPFSAARELTRVATPDTEADWLAACAGKNLRDIEDMVAAHDPGDRPTDPPNPRPKKKKLVLVLASETHALLRQAHQVLERERSERLDEEAVLAAAFRMVIDGEHAREPAADHHPAPPHVGGPDPAGPGAADVEAEPADVRDPGRAPYQIALTVCEQCKRGWQDGGGITVEVSPAAIERARCDAQELGSVDAVAPARASQSIPPAVRRLVLRRDHGNCRVPWCRSWRNIDVHHVVHREHGGTNDPLNLLCLCEAHHLATHDGTIVIGGTAPDWTFTRKPHNSFTIASHAADTAKALKALGFARDEVTRAVEAAKTHVGDQALTLEQWVLIALRYCPRPIISTTS